MFLQSPSQDTEVRELFDTAQEEDGYVPNFIQLWAWRPDVHLAYSNARKLLNARTNLSAREVAVLNSTTASRLGDSYCSIAWGTRLASETDAPTAAAVLSGAETPGLSAREQALERWATALVKNPNDTTQEDVEALRQAGLSDQDVFDATVLVAFRLAFGTVNDALGAQPDWQLAESAPAAVLDSVTYGRTVDGVTTT